MAGNKTNILTHDDCTYWKSVDVASQDETFNNHIKH
jgi:hypothetical protein